MRMRILFVGVVLVAMASAEALNVRKQDLPVKVDAGSRTYFGPFPGSLCRAEIYPIGVAADATSCSCTDVSRPVLPSFGPFANTSCFRVSALGASTFQLKVTCGDDKMSVFGDQSLRVTVTDAAPVCRNYTIAVGKGRESRFFLLASDSDDDVSQFHIRNDSLTALRGRLRYCYRCSNTPDGSPDIDSNWQDYSSVVNGPGEGALFRFSRMFSYAPPTDMTEGFVETLRFSARDVSEQQCDADGVVTFKAEVVTAPTLQPAADQAVFVGRAQLLRFSADSATSQLRFMVKTIPPSCVLLCPITEAARVSLRDFPGEPLAGQILEPCGPSNALKPNTDVTLTSSRSTFFKQTFLTVKAVADCGGNPVSFTLTSSADGVESQPITQTLRAAEVVQRCVAFDVTFSPSAPTTFTADRFVSAAGPLSVTTLTTGTFRLQSGGSNLVGGSITGNTELVFVGDTSVDVTVMVRAANPDWTGYCKLSFRSSASAPTSPPPTKTTPAPTPLPTVGQTTSTPTPSPTGKNGVSSGTSSLLYVAIAVLAVVAYVNRAKISAFFKPSPTPGSQSTANRKYGVVTNTENED